MPRRLYGLGWIGSPSSSDNVAHVVTATNVNATGVLDGFTIQGQSSISNVTGAGVVINPNIAGTRILDNIVQNNVTGIYLSNNSATDACVIQHNNTATLAAYVLYRFVQYALKHCAKIKCGGYLAANIIEKFK